ncbi:Transposase (plasmid) [Nostoc flagelliforme CCNUN1]|uniref:Transposase n=1 Tax=Nostoc flagelliforme CCNUN1 TaxID=2038116 RepID=A0A2K8T7T1_9NOSO|nr:IS5 family transposase [Nostoc flagelliforme]AUB35997.1 Transposase [Nostoc flagelliforme CCNUN1]AUB37009.1 Transposase [Nostoc flagelliforme CCNUN1]AUB43756.1 Transposase [Nostoc flagelliforme CCNUN1]AUB43777.1 Transposase [Nostoc flagelliforme CCNUN1]AUB43795.1 Transposase [Nostoc flagelliforme CCNUN1]
MSKSYSTNLTQEQWELIEPLIPAPLPGGRPRETNIWEVMNAIFYVLYEGCRWRALPGDFPNWQTVYTYFRNWRKDGTWVRMHDRLREWTRVASERSPSPSEAIVDSQSIKSAAMVSEAVGYDAGKKVKGRKRFVTVDTLGLVLRVLITAASVGEREGGKQVLKKVKQMEPSLLRLHTIWVDAGFDGNPFMQWVMDFCRWIIQVVIRPKESKKFVLLPKRWVVERTLGWLTWCRRLNKDYELLPETAETFIYIAMIRIMVRRLA